MKTSSISIMIFLLGRVSIKLPACIFSNYLISFLLVFLSFQALSQTTPAPPAFHQIVSHSYGIPDGLPDVCIRQVVLDSRGRLHMAACPNYYASSALLMYEFDGTKAFRSKFKLEHDPEYIWFNEVPAPDMFYGFYDYRNQRDSLQSVVFQYDVIARVTQSFDLEEKLVVRNVAFAESTLFVCTYEKSKQEVKIFSINNGVFTLLHSLKAKPRRSDEEIRLFLAVTEKDIWLAHAAGHIFRINRKDKSERRYALPGVDDQMMYVKQLINSPQNGIWINCDGIYYFEEAKDSFVKNPYLPAGWKPDSPQESLLSRDLKGNMLLWYLKNDTISSATLVDTRNQAFDYTPIAWNRPIAGGGTNKTWMSNDFKKGIVYFHPGLQFVEFSPYNAVQHTFELKQNRSIAELHRDTIYSGKHGVLYHNNGAWKSTGSFIVGNGKIGDGDMKVDKKGNIWIPKFPPRKYGTNVLYRYQPTLHRIDSFQLETALVRFDFMGEHQVVYATYDKLYLLNTATGKTQPLLGKERFYLEGLNQVFVSSENMVWVACKKGLLCVDPRKGSHKWVNLADQATVMRIHEDASGRLWLGTLIKGILIYNPATGSVKNIDQSKGLSNNLVVSLLEDEEGIIWAGTYHGITLISPEGMVLGSIFKKDGLAEDECNRWSALKMKDGRLVFGSTTGLSFIDPKLLKKRIQEGELPKIYLTGLSNEASKKQLMATDLLSKFNKNERIDVPANSRNLKINFALSNYIAPEKSTFAFKIEGYDNDWNYIGNLRILSLNALPTGKYDILIKGADSWGRWSEPPIVIPVHVHEFAYKTWWAFCLYGLIALTVLYLIRKNQIKLLKEEAEIKHLHEIDSIKSKLYTNITHEFRTPLTVISGMADMIEKPENAKKLIKRNSEGLLRLVNQLLDLAKLEAGHLKLELVQADVVPYIQYLLESIQSLAESKKIHLVFIKSTNQLVMDFDEKRLAIIISNLLSNAIKFSRQNGHIILEVRQEKGQLLLKVRDNGVGIPLNMQTRIFERFYQVDDTATRKGEGTGIGLTLTKELVELMGGKITMQSPHAEGEGTEFTISLPVHLNAQKSLASKPALAEATPEPAEMVEQNHSPKNPDLPLLLLIEDNQDVVTYIKFCLEGRYEIEWAGNGAIGIEKALETIPDIIISDVMMPEKDGFEVCRTLKNDERTSHIPIVLLTAKVDAQSRLEGLGVGADAYLSKPFQKEELFIRLEKLVELRRRLQEKYAGKDFVSLTTETLTPTAPSPHDAFLKRATSLLLEHLDDAVFGNEELARHMNMSESSLNRKIKALTTKTLSLFIRSVRLQQAKILLQTTDKNISEIAYSTGFNDPAYFSRVFSQEFGMAPSRFQG